MKKTYSKPQIMFEAFTLSTNIASGCGVITKLPSEGTCGFTPERWDPDVVIFNVGVGVGDGACTTGPIGDYNGLCYDNPSAGTGMNLFTS